jgi:hypothetical protein
MEHPFQTQIQQLFQAGIVTHIVENPDNIDPLFALSKVRDFPQVTFAAAFDNGSVILGCAGNLPDPLAAIAAPIANIAIAEDDTAGAAHDDTFHTKLDTVSDQLERLIATTASADQNQATELKLLARFDVLETEFAANQPTQRDGSAVERTLAELKIQITSLTNCIQSDPHQFEIKKQITQIKADTSACLSQLNATHETNPTHDILQAFRVATEDIRRDLSLQFASDDNTAHFAKIDETQSILKQNLADMSADLKTFCALQGADAVRHDEDVMRQEQTSEQSKILGDLSAKLDQVAINAMSDKTPQLSANIAHLSTLVTDLAKRPVPMVDLTGQRKSHARFETAMAAIIARFESISLDHPASVIDDAQLQSALQKMQKLPDVIENMNSILSQIPEGQSDILSTLAAVQQRPDPILDLTEQRRSLSNFADAMNLMIKRLEAVTLAVSSQEPDPRVDTIMSQVSQINTQLSHPGIDPALIDAIGVQTREIATFREDLTTQLARPAPQLDLTAQRRSFAQFGTALSTAMARLETVTSQLDGLPNSSENPRILEDHVNEPALHAPCPQPTFAIDTDALDAFRLSFAELLATQFMETAHVASVGKSALRQG